MPRKHVSTSSGYWFGLDINFGALLGQFNLGTPPFRGTLDPTGGSVFLLPPPIVPSGLTLFAVTVEFDAALNFVGNTAPVSFTTL